MRRESCTLWSTNSMRDHWIGVIMDVNFSPWGMSASHSTCRMRVRNRERWNRHTKCHSHFWCQSKPWVNDYWWTHQISQDMPIVWDKILRERWKNRSRAFSSTIKIVDKDCADESDKDDPCPISGAQSAPKLISSQGIGWFKVHQQCTKQWAVHGVERLIQSRW